MPATPLATRPLLLVLLLVIVGAAPCAFAVPAIPNPSFEDNAAFTNAPGSVGANAPIVGWSTTDAANTGLNPVNGVDHFADNGRIPNGTRVLFVRSVNNTVYVSTTLTGLSMGSHYKVNFRINCRTSPTRFYAGCRIGEGPWVPVDKVTAADPAGVHTSDYKTFTTYFVASDSSALLQIYHSTEAFGGDATLLLDDFKIEAATPIRVTSLNNYGPGTLRAVLQTAAATTAFNVITFDPAFSGKTIDGTTPFVLNDPSGLAIDASTLPKGLTVSGIPVDIHSGLHLRGLTFTNSQLFGAIYNRADQPVLISRCTFITNRSTMLSTGGAVTNAVGNTVLSRCTFTGNTTVNEGGAVKIDGGSVTLEHCTISGNGATSLGGGIHLRYGDLYLFNSIVSGNTAGSGGADICNAGGLLVYRGANVAQNIAPGSTVGGAPLSGSPMLAALADNGGPTKTMALQPGSSARNAAVGSTALTDQRGRPVCNGADIGAYEVQPGTLSLLHGASVDESPPSNVAFASIVRTDGFEGTITVRLTASPGTASAADFTPITNELITFSEGLATYHRFVAVTPDQIDEVNETINVSLSAPGGGALLGSPAATTITIIDSSSQSPATDSTRPGAIAFASPLAGAVVDSNGSITITGTASDNKGVAAVRVRITADGVAPTDTQSATLESPDAPSTKWSCTYTAPAGATPTNLLIEASATDGAGNESAAFSSRSIKVRYPLAVVLGGDGAVSPAGYAPVSYREAGSVYTLTAVPSPGWLFAGWTASVPSAEIGLPTVALLRPTLTFIHKADLRLVAQFAPSPYNSSLTGNYRGLVTSSESPGTGLVKANRTNGLFTATLSATGAFSGTLTIDGLVLNFAGALDHLGKARFGTSRATTLLIPRSLNSSLVLSFEMESSGSQMQPRLSGKVEATSMVESFTRIHAPFIAKRSHYNGTSIPVSPALLNNGSSAVYNVIMEPQYSQPVSWYPMGVSFGRMTLTNAGTVTLAGTLSDGTAGVSGSAFLDNTNTAEFFIPLYNRGGFLRLRMVFGSSLPSASAPLADWCRPPNINSHYYPGGWQEPVRLWAFASLFKVTLGKSVLSNGPGGLGVPDADGNVEIVFGGDLRHRLNISSTDTVTKIPANNPFFTLSISRTTGLFSGSFTDWDANVLPFQGIILQTVGGTHARGFYLSKPTVPIDYSGSSGEVTLFVNP